MIQKGQKPENTDTCGFYCYPLRKADAGSVPYSTTNTLKSQPLSVGIFFARSPNENRNDVASVAPWTARFAARFPQIPLSVISRDASARDATSFIFNDLQAAGSISNLVGRWGIGKRIGTVCRISGGWRGFLRTSPKGIAAVFGPVFSLRWPVLSAPAPTKIGQVLKHKI